MQIWHLIPVYPFWILLFFGGIYAIFEKYTPSKAKLLFYLVLIPCLFVCVNQIKQIWYQIIDIPAFVSDIAILSKEASKYPYPLLVDGDFIPTAYFYSQKVVYKIKRNDVGLLFLRKDRFLLITNEWPVPTMTSHPESFKVIKKDRDKVLVLH